MIRVTIETMEGKHTQDGIQPIHLHTGAKILKHRGTHYHPVYVPVPLTETTFILFLIICICCIILKCIRVEYCILRMGTWIGICTGNRVRGAPVVNTCAGTLILVTGCPDRGCDTPEPEFMTR